MVEPLRQRKNGKPYKRRSAVENELQEFEKLNLPEVLARARHGERRAMDSVSSEALVYILRREARTGTRGPGVDGLVSLLARTGLPPPPHSSFSSADIRRLRSVYVFTPPPSDPADHHLDEREPASGAPTHQPVLASHDVTSRLGPSPPGAPSARSEYRS